MSGKVQHPGHIIIIIIIVIIIIIAIILIIISVIIIIIICGNRFLLFAPVDFRRKPEPVPRT